MTRSSFEGSYRAAVALNNVGVSLLDRRCFLGAVETFGRAVKCMKAASLAQPDQASTKRLSSPDDHDEHYLEEHLHIANGLLAGSSPSSDNDTSYNLLGLGTITFGDVGTDTIGKCLVSRLREANDKELLAIRIDASLHDQDAYSLLFEVESAIITHNFALAHMLLAQGSMSSQRKLTLINTAFQLTKFSCTIIENLPEHGYAESFVDEDIQPLSIVMHMPLVLLASICTSGNELVHYEQSIAEMVLDFLDHYEYTLSGQHFVKAAPAA